MDIIIDCAIVIGSALLISAYGIFCYYRGVYDGKKKGREKGYSACEQMILMRADDHEDHDLNKVWKDLIR